MRIEAIEVERLFGTFNHKIPLNLDDRITIIHGPNGFGKTVVLEMVYHLFQSKFSQVLGVPFEKFLIRLGGSLCLVVTRQVLEAEPKARNVDARSSEVHQDPYSPDWDSSSPLLEWEEDFRSVAERPAERRRLRIRLIEAGEVAQRLSVDVERQDPTLRHIVGSREAVRWKGMQDQDWEVEDLGLPDWWRELALLLQVSMIHEHRRLDIGAPASGDRGRRPRLVPVVTQYAQELALEMEDCLAESAELSQNLDRSFPNRLIERIGQKRHPRGNLKKELKKLEDKRARLQAVGLLDAQEEEGFSNPPNLGEETRYVLGIYVEDTRQKLAVFDDLANRLALFLEIANERFLFKTLRVTKDKGFFFESEDGSELPLEALSSGEQHELVLLYQLLFKVDSGSLVLIDEPELSLHIAWQQKFLEDLTRITEIAQFDVLIATHSPQIIHDRWDLTVELKSPSKSSSADSAA